jgi:hypothetical protein
MKAETPAQQIEARAAAERIEQIARTLHREPRDVLHAYVSACANVVRAWMWDEMTSDDQVLLEHALMHLENAEQCVEAFARPAEPTSATTGPAAARGNRTV